MAGGPNPARRHVPCGLDSTPWFLCSASLPRGVDRSAGTSSDVLKALLRRADASPLDQRAAIAAGLLRTALAEREG